MANDVTQPVSMLGAGMPEDPSIAQTQSLMPSPMALPQMNAPGPNPGLAFGSGMLQGLAGGQGNPYLTQQAQQAHQGQGQQLQMLQMYQQQQHQMQVLQQKALEMKQSKELQQQRMTLDVGLHLLNSESSDARAVGGRTIAAPLKSMGGPDVTALIDSMVTRSVKSSDMDNFMRQVYQGKDYETITRMFPWAKPEQYSQAQQALKHDPTLKALNLPTSTDLRKQEADLAIAEGNAISAREGLKGSPDMIEATRMMHRKLNDEMDYQYGTPKTQREAWEAADRERQAREEKKARLAAELKTETLLTGIDARLAAGLQKQQMTPVDGIKYEKALKPLQYAVKSLDTVQQLRNIVNNLPDYIFPTGPSALAQYTAKTKRAFWPGDANWQQFQLLWPAITIGFDRGYFDDKGARFKGAYGPVTEYAENFPPKAATLGYLDTVESMIKEQGNKTVKGYGRVAPVGGPLERQVFDDAREIWAPYGEIGKGATPLAPKLPPGTKLEGGKLISESGKFEWNGQAWTPRR